VAAFEAEFSTVVGGRPCVAVNSGTSALHLGLLANGVGPGDEVIVPSFSFAATANAVALTGATPVFADISPDNFCLSAAAVEAAITPRTVGVMPVHLYGHPADMDGLSEVTDRHGLALYEDAAQAHLASLHRRPVGTFGAVAAFSFYPTKNMTSGEGGMVVCADESIARQVRLLRNQGMEKRYANEVVGFNSRMTDLHAAIGRVQLARLDEWAGRFRDRPTTVRRSWRRPRVAPVHGQDHRPGRPYPQARRARRGLRRVLPDSHPPAAVVRPPAGPPRDRAGIGRGAVTPGAPRPDRIRPRSHRRGRP
jgi:perosamine synthetase